MADKLNAERSRIHYVATHLAFPRDEYFFNGSTVLALHGIPRERPMGDIDIFTTTSLWFECQRKFNVVGQTYNLGEYRLSNNEWALVLPPPHDPKRRCDPPILRGHLFDITVDIFLNWRRRGGGLGDFDPAFYMANVEMVGDPPLPCAPLQFIMDWKLAQGRNKDLADVIAIRQHMGIEGGVTD